MDGRQPGWLCNWMPVIQPDSCGHLVDHAKFTRCDHLRISVGSSYPNNMYITGLN